MPTRKRGTGGPAFTVAMPNDLPVRKGERDAWWLDLPERELRLSNLDKVFWPDEAITKGDVIAYYANVADLLLPHLEHRPLTMKRMPDGIDGDAFYEKTAPSHTPEWVHRCTVLSEDAKAGRIDYLTVDDLPTLLFVANLGAIEMHPLHSRCEDVEHPDYLFFDLDPFPPYTYEDVLAVARHIRVLLDGFGMTGHPKTSGATGLQIFVRLEPGSATYAEVRAFVGACGSLIKQADPDRVTMAWRVADRAGKIFIDHNMNRRGANIAAAYSLRPEPRAPVSTPLTWDEVEAGGFEPQEFRIDNVWERFAMVGDLWDGVRTGPAADVRGALDALGVEVEEDDEPGRLPRTASPSVATKTSDEIALASKDPALFEYVRRREFGPAGTTEPAPGDEAGAGNSFVIHKHRATRLHYDVRLEKDGGLPSWAVPKGLPTQKGDKRLAVQTEVHPLEYGKFAGTIPEGHYGAGEVRIFDDGWYEPIEWTDTKVSFRLHGRRYPGIEFHFVKTRTDWLAFLASNQTAPMIASPPRFQPMLAEGGWDPFDDPGWWFEPKFDGIRCLAELSTGQTVLRTRTGRDATAQYPEIHMVHELVDQVNAVIDGEIVAFDEDGQELLRGPPAADEPREPPGDRPGAQADPCRAGGVRSAVARRARHHRARPRGTARAAGPGRRTGRAPPGRDPRRGRRHRAGRSGARAGAGGRGGETPRHAVRPGQTHGRVAQDQDQEHAGLRGPRLHARPGGPQHDVRRAPRGRLRRRRGPPMGRPGRQWLHRRHAHDGARPAPPARAAGSRRSTIRN